MRFPSFGNGRRIRGPVGTYYADVSLNTEAVVYQGSTLRGLRASEGSVRFKPGIDFIFGAAQNIISSSRWRAESGLQALRERISVNEGGVAITISANTLTPTQHYHTCGNTSSSTLKTIAITNFTTNLGNADGALFRLRPTAATPFLWDTTGNIGAAGQGQQNAIILFVYVAAKGKWYPSY
jgi:hypothetical protein